MTLCQNTQTTSQLVLETWANLLPLIEERLNYPTSLFNYLARMDLMLLKANISLEQLTVLSCGKQKALELSLQSLELGLRSCDHDPQWLADYLEQLNLICG
jgi:hypothetical protein